MKIFIICFFLTVGLCMANSYEDKFEEVFRKFFPKPTPVRERILARSSDDNIRANDYMPEGLKELIKEKLTEIPDDGPNDRIVGGSIAPKNGYPYQVGLSLAFATGGTSWCGGSIISNSYIISAAHCFDGVRSVTVYAGAHDRTNSFEVGRVEQTVSSRNVIVHSGWSSATMLNDIALVRLDRPLTFTSQIQAVALPTQSFANIDGQTGTISGWGHYDPSKQLSRYLRHVQSQIVNISHCTRYFNSYVRSSNVCLDGSRGQGTCNGDSGGPLVVVSSTGEKVIVGLTSFGSGQGCHVNWPTVYTRVTSYLQWIQQNARIAE